MNNKLQIKKEYAQKLIYKSFDGILTEKEQAALNEVLESSEELRKFREETLTLRNNIKNSAYSEFDPYFESRLLAKISQPPKQSGLLSGLSDSLEFSFRKIIITAAVLLIMLVLYNVKQGNLSSIENILGIYNTPIEYALDPAFNLFGNDI